MTIVANDPVCSTKSTSFSSSDTLDMIDRSLNRSYNLYELNEPSKNNILLDITISLFVLDNSSVSRDTEIIY